MSPFEDLNGFRYHDNWLRNFLIASSLNARGLDTNSVRTSNVLESEQLSEQQALQEYKGQQGNERGFRFLKDPMFFASSVFLKSPESIMALGMIMACACSWTAWPTPTPTSVETG